MAAAMRLEVIRATALRAQPAPKAKILQPLAPGAILIASEFSGEWTEASISPGDVTGWVLTQDCRQTQESRTTALDLKRLAEKRRQAAATPIGSPPEASKDQPPRFDDDDDEPRIQYQQMQRQQQQPAKQKTQQELWYEQERLIKQRQERANAKAAAKAAETDTVDVSVFGPPSIRAGVECLVQIFLHTLDQAAEIAQQAKEADAASGRRGVKTLATDIARGTQVQIIFEGRGLLTDDATQPLTWRGEPDTCKFIVTAPADAVGKTFYPRILVLVNSVPVGSVAFALPATAKDAPAETVIRGDDARRYRYAFLSYSSTDRAEVLKRAQGLKAGRIDFFQDILSLEPGEKWAPKLYEEIDRCDLFLLFWSSAAKASPWVTKEVEYALARQKSSSGVPDITPVIIEGPPPPSPPDALKDIHFNDSLMYVLAAVEAQVQSPKPG